MIEVANKFESFVFSSCLYGFSDWALREKKVFASSEFFGCRWDEKTFDFVWKLKVLFAFLEDEIKFRAKCLITFHVQSIWYSNNLLIESSSAHGKGKHMAVFSQSCCTHSHALSVLSRKSEKSYEKMFFFLLLYDMVNV